jgi:hypothetical protein
MIRLCLLLLILSSTVVFAKKKIIIEYRKYEKFDFNALNIEGTENSPGDLSISPRFRKEFRNRIPERKNFKKKMINALNTLN